MEIENNIKGKEKDNYINFNNKILQKKKKKIMKINKKMKLTNLHLKIEKVIFYFFKKN